MSFSDIPLPLFLAGIIALIFLPIGYNSEIAGDNRNIFIGIGFTALSVLVAGCLFILYLMYNVDDKVKTTPPGIDQNYGSHTAQIASPADVEIEMDFTQNSRHPQASVPPPQAPLATLPPASAHQQQFSNLPRAQSSAQAQFPQLPPVNDYTTATPQYGVYASSHSNYSGRYSR